MIVAELEQQLAVRLREMDEIKEARAKDARDLLANAKDRLNILHAEVNPSTSLISRLTKEISCRAPFCQNRLAMSQNISEPSKISLRIIPCSSMIRQSWDLCSPIHATRCGLYARRSTSCGRSSVLLAVCHPRLVCMAIWLLRSADRTHAPDPVHSRAVLPNEPAGAG